MTELEAVNMMLRLIGSSPVNDIDTPHPDVANAKTTLDRIRKQEQRTGWWFNIEYGMSFSPNEVDEIIVPSTFSSLVINDTRFIQRGNKLYNRCDQTYKFAEPVDVYKGTLTLPWDEMPDVMQEYCAYKSAAEFVRDELEDPQKQADLLQTAAQMGVRVKKQELEEGQYNMFHSARTQQARAGVQPYHRNNRRFFGDPDV